MTLGKGMFKLFSCVFACVFFALGVTRVAHAYDVTYECGDYSDGVSSPPASVFNVETNDSFVPAANTCVSSMPNKANFVGWAVSGTTDIRPAGQAFNWDYDEDKKFTAIWDCWPNEDDTDCLSGYEIVFALRPVDSTWNPPVPDKIYTIYGVGAYLDAERTQKMEVGGGPYRIIPPTKPALIVTLHTNGPNNPVFLPDEVSRTTTPASYEPQNVQSSFTRFEYGPLSPTVSYGSNAIPEISVDCEGCPF